MQVDLDLIPGSEDPLEKEMATYSSILAWRILWTKEPDGLQSMGSQRVGHDWVPEHSTAVYSVLAASFVQEVGPVKAAYFQLPLLW